MKAHTVIFHLLGTVLLIWPLFIVLTMAAVGLGKSIPLLILLAQGFIIYRSASSRWWLLLLVLNPALFLPLRATYKAIDYYISGYPTKRYCTDYSNENRIYDTNGQVWLEYDNDDCDGEQLNVYDKTIQNSLTDWLIKKLGNPSPLSGYLPDIKAYCHHDTFISNSDTTHNRRIINEANALTWEKLCAGQGVIVNNESRYSIENGLEFG